MPTKCLRLEILMRIPKFGPTNAPKAMGSIWSESVKELWGKLIEKIVKTENNNWTEIFPWFQWRPLIIQLKSSWEKETKL